jgi:hypothetical protein
MLPAGFITGSSTGELPDDELSPPHDRVIEHNIIVMIRFFILHTPEFRKYLLLNGIKYILNFVNKKDDQEICYKDECVCLDYSILIIYRSPLCVILKCLSLLSVEVCATRLISYRYRS